MVLPAHVPIVDLKAQYDGIRPEIDASKLQMLAKAMTAPTLGKDGVVTSVAAVANSVNLSRHRASRPLAFELKGDAG